MVEIPEGLHIVLHGGATLNFLEPEKSKITIEAIAHSLSKLCRFTGHIDGDGIYSVAEHSYWVSYFAPREDALEALLHDGAEAFTNDLNSPFKDNSQGVIRCRQ